MGLGDRLQHDGKLLDVPGQGNSRPARHARGRERRGRAQAFANLVDPMLELSKCKDFVVNRGHYFGTDKFAEEPGLSDAQKRDLIEFLKTL